VRLFALPSFPLKHTLDALLLPLDAAEASTRSAIFRSHLSASAGRARKCSLVATPPLLRFFLHRSLLPALRLEEGIVAHYETASAYAAMSTRTRFNPPLPFLLLNPLLHLFLRPPPLALFTSLLLSSNSSQDALPPSLPCNSLRHRFLLRRRLHCTLRQRRPHSSRPRLARFDSRLSTSSER
jgi:hypothetical protein